MKRVILALISTCASFHHACYSLEDMELSAKTANFDGSALLLSGDVQIQNIIGDLAADNINCQTDQNKKISKIDLDGNVAMQLKGDQSLKCQNAQLDISQHSAVLLGNDVNPDVVYERSPNDKEAFLQILSRRMAIGFKENADQRWLLDAVQADDKVRINYKNDYASTADKAVYQHFPNGKIVLASDDANANLCEVTDKKGSRIHSRQIEIDTEKKSLDFDHPTGSLEDAIEFSTDKLTWDDATQTLQLEGDVHIKQKGFGEVVTNHQMKMVLHIVDGKKVIHTIEAPQESELTFADDIKGLVHQLSCYGPLSIDNERGQVMMESPEGAVENDKQVHFSNRMGDLYADRALLSYKRNDKNAIVPTSLRMEGHVKCLNRFDGHLQESGLVLQYSLADAVEYFPEKHELLLSGKDKNRVLLFDRVKNMQMSAPSLKIFNLEPDKKPTIQGMGDVRMKFAERELQQMKQYFHFEDPS